MSRTVQSKPPSVNELVRRNEELQARLEEAEETLRAIRSGEVDAVIVSGSNGEQVFTLKGEDHAYRALVEAMNEGAAILSMNGVVIYCNSHFPPIFGLTEESVTGRLLGTVVPAAHSTNIQDMFVQASEGAAPEGEFRFNLEDGTRRVIHVSFNRVETADAPSLCMVVTDISQNQGEVMLRLAQKAAHSGSWQWNPVTNECVWSPEYWEIFGLKAGSCRPNYENFLESIHPGDRYEVEAAMKRQVVDGSFELQFRTQWPDSSVHWIALFGKVVSPDCVIGLSMDITERKYTEQALIRTEKLASVGRMAATISHEINNPLSAVMNSLFLVQGTEGLPTDASRYIAIAEEELKRIAHITQRSLGFYRERTDPISFGVDSLITSVIDLLQPRIEAKRIALIKECSPDLRMTAVFGEMRQVFSNLVHNAIDAVATGGTIRIRAAAVERFIQIAVSDDGCGIEPGALSRLFEPFFTTKSAIGTGLGLWVSKQIVEKHQGRIDVQSHAGEAHRETTFLVEIPIAAD